MNRAERRAAGFLTAKEEQRVMPRLRDNAYHWGEIKRIKRDYDALNDIQKAERKAEMAVEIDGHLSALIGN